jgi:hypothetical protein
MDDQEKVGEAVIGDGMDEEGNAVVDDGHDEEEEEEEDGYARRRWLEAKEAAVVKKEARAQTKPKAETQQACTDDDEDTNDYSSEGHGRTHMVGRGLPQNFKDFLYYPKKRAWPNCLSDFFFVLHRKQNAQVTFFL